MERGNLFTVIILLVSSQIILAKQFKLTEHPHNNLGIYNSNSPSTSPRDVSYLPEDDYDSQEDSEDEIVEGIGEGTPHRESERYDRNLRPEYRNLCETKTRKVEMNDDEYEYQPPHYHETYCKSYSLIDHSVRNPLKPPRQLCAHPGFHCVQRSRTVSLVRRRWSDTCWEVFSKEIASGCDCMWPVSSLGDITAHY